MPGLVLVSSKVQSHSKQLQTSRKQYNWCFVTNLCPACTQLFFNKHFHYIICILVLFLSINKNCYEQDVVGWDLPEVWLLLVLNKFDSNLFLHLINHSLLSLGCCSNAHGLQIYMIPLVLVLPAKKSETEMKPEIILNNIGDITVVCSYRSKEYIKQGYPIPPCANLHSRWNLWGIWHFVCRSEQLKYRDKHLR